MVDYDKVLDKLEDWESNLMDQFTENCTPDARREFYAWANVVRDVVYLELLMIRVGE